LGEKDAEKVSKTPQGGKNLASNHTKERKPTPKPTNPTSSGPPFKKTLNGKKSRKRFWLEAKQKKRYKASTARRSRQKTRRKTHKLEGEIGVGKKKRYVIPGKMERKIAGGGGYGSTNDRCWM